VKPESFDVACFIIATEIAELVIKKQHDYGHGNINAYGELGIKVRVSDKKERLKNLLDKIDEELNSKPLNESLEDSWMDIAGYGIIGLMWTRGWFDLELEDK
jgi:hypothetical protein